MIWWVLAAVAYGATASAATWAWFKYKKTQRECWRLLEENIEKFVALLSWKDMAYQLAEELDKLDASLKWRKILEDLSASLKED